MDPFHDPAYYNLGYACYRINDLDQAIKNYRKGIEVNQGQPSAECYFNLATALQENKQLFDALQEFKESLKHDPDNLDCIHKITHLAEKMEMWLEAYKYHKKGVKEFNDQKSKAAIPRLKKIMIANEIEFEE